MAHPFRVQERVRGHEMAPQTASSQLLQLGDLVKRGAWVVEEYHRTVLYIGGREHIYCHSRIHSVNIHSLTLSDIVFLFPLESL